MGFLSGMLDKSVFNKKSYQSAIGKDNNNGYAVVKITPRIKRVSKNDKDFADPPIKGVYDYSEGGLEFSVNANWEPLGGIAQSVLPGGSVVGDAYSKVNQGASLFGVANIGAGWASKLIYQKSGHLEIRVPIMIVDWEGIGQPIMSAKLLSLYCLPTEVMNISETLQNNSEKIEQEIENMRGSLNEMAQSTGKLTDVATAAGANGLTKAGEAVEGVIVKGKKILDAADQIGAVDNFKNNLLDDDAVTLRSSPSPVILEIGEYFKHDDMVIQNVNFQFSKEMTTSGPLFVKANISLISRKIMTSPGDIGIKNTKQGISRWQEMGGSQSNATGI